MKTIDYLYDLISENEVTLIGYRFSDERIKDEIISNLGRTKTIDLSSSFSMKSIIRDMKIDTILNNRTEPATHFLLDINNFMVGRGELSRANVINNALRKIANCR